MLGDSQTERLLVHTAHLLNLLFGRREEGHHFEQWSLLAESLQSAFLFSAENCSISQTLLENDASFRRRVLVYVNASVGLGLKLDSLEDAWGSFNVDVFDINFVENTKHLDVVLRARAIAESVLGASKPARAVDHLLRSFDALG